ncbi:hypothetical protein ACFYRN_19245 [Streptomyces sp. NPDC005227]|uniref:hypothetical protein n=1 Tax=Streptomyces sp. NPDC005227 TaxID=3364707 RepID=UPI00368A23A9
MADDTQTAAPPASPGTYGRCAWHDGITRDLRLITVIEAGSGPATSGHRYACHPCQIEHGLIPLADRP